MFTARYGLGLYVHITSMLTFEELKASNLFNLVMWRPQVWIIFIGAPSYVSMTPSSDRIILLISYFCNSR